MQNETLNKYIKDQRTSGYSDAQIIAALKKAGWSLEAINSVIMPQSQDINETSEGSSVNNLQAEQSELSESPWTQSNSVVSPGLSVISGSNMNNDMYEATGSRRGSLKDSWLLLKKSFSIIRYHHRLMQHPFLSFIVTTLIGLLFYAIGYVLSIDSSEVVPYAGTILGIAYIMITAFIVTFFNVALTAHTLDIFRGRDQPTKTYRMISVDAISTIFAYAALSTTLGQLLKLIEGRSRIMVAIIRSMIGFAWTLANFFTLSYIADGKRNVFEAIKSSAQLFRSRWGDSVLASVGVTTFFTFVTLFVLVPLAVLGYVIIFDMEATLSVFAVWTLVVILGALYISILQSTVYVVLKAALYYFARYEELPADFTAEELNLAIRKSSKARRAGKLF